MRIPILGLAFLAGIGFSGSVPADGTFLPSWTPAPASSAAPLTLVRFERLIPFLPEPADGWGAELPDGYTTDTDDFKLSTAHRTYYFKGDRDDEPTASVTIIDSANTQNYFESPSAVWKNDANNANGYDKRVMIEGMRAFEHYDKAARSCSLSVFVGKRYFVQVELTGQDPKELRRWFKRIDVERLAALR